MKKPNKNMEAFLLGVFAGETLYLGVPPLMDFGSHGKVGFVEVKRPGETPRPIQVHRHKLLRQLGAKVYVLDHPDNIGGILDDIQTT